MADCSRGMWALPLSNGAKSLCALLWTWLDTVDGGRVWPSIGYLAESTGQNERTVRRQIDELAAANLVKRDGRALILSKIPDAKLGTSARVPRSEKRAPAPGDRACASEKAGTSTHQGNQEGTRSGNQSDQGCSLPKRDFAKEAWDWCERKCIEAGIARKHRGLSSKNRKLVQSLLKHISETLGCPIQEAARSQCEHLKWRIARAHNDDDTRKRLRKPTPWRTGWWDYWYGEVGDTGPIAMCATEAEAEAYAQEHGRPPAGWEYTGGGKLVRKAAS